MKRYFLIIVAAVLATSFIYTCCSAPTDPGRRETADESIPYSEDAMWISLYLSDRLVAPDSLYRIVAKDLHGILSKYGQEYEKLAKIHFRFPWINNQLLIGFTADTYPQVEEGTYTAWDTLNTIYRVCTITCRYGFATLSFDSIVHMKHLAEYYRELPGVKYVCRNYWGGSPTNIYPKVVDEHITYLFLRAWGSGCIENICDEEYWYFAVESSGHDLIGYWPRYEDPNKPDWWDRACENIYDWYDLE